MRHHELQRGAVLQRRGGRDHPELEHPKPQRGPLRLIWYTPALTWFDEGFSGDVFFVVLRVSSLFSLRAGGPAGGAVRSHGLGVGSGLRPGPPPPPLLLG